MVIPIRIVCAFLRHQTQQQTIQHKRHTQGWIDRTFLPHAAFTLPGPGSPPPSVVGLVPQLQNIKSVSAYGQGVLLGYAHLGKLLLFSRLWLVC